MPHKLRKSKAPPPPPGCPMGTCMGLLGGAWTPNLIWREVAPTSPPSVEYTLSDLGKELIPVIDSIVRVGTRLLQPRVRPSR
jgi:DNA-binding HxlR family transcriptional regulator